MNDKAVFISSLIAFFVFAFVAIVCLGFCFYCFSFYGFHDCNIAVNLFTLINLLYKCLINNRGQTGLIVAEL